MTMQPASTEIASRTAAIIQEMRGLEGPLLPILHGIQEEFGHVPQDSLPVIAEALNIDRADIVDAAWVDNGPGWVAVMLKSADAVLALKPRPIDFDLGVVGPYPSGSPQAFELRAFFPKDGATVEDPVTGSLNASVAQWLLGSGKATAPYIASQGTALGRAGRVHITQDADGKIWVGGGTVTCISGQVKL